jgi:PIN domain nuclease of toxin-antitoxin system
VGQVILDASVIIAFLDSRDASHQRAVTALGAVPDRRIPASVLAEVLVHPRREGTAAVAKVERALAALATGVEPLTADIARAAASLRARHRRLRLGDALVIATGDALGVDVLTVDRGFSGVSPRVRLV